MGALKLAGLALALAIAAPARADPVAQWRPHVAEASARFGIPEDWIERVMRAESGGRTMFRGKPVTSHAGAMGLMQLMPGTWKEMRARLRLGEDPHQPRDNILAGTFYLRLMYDRFGYPGMFAAYNAGPGRYAAYLSGRERLPGETIDYLEKVAGAAQTSGAQMPSARPARPPNDPAPDGKPQPPGKGAGDIFFINRPQPQSRTWVGARLGNAKNNGRRTGSQGRRPLQF
ncbi:MAG: lytic transglycosylase domain-containing protein [Sphingomonadales bacterium]|nr:MAG: lytic transglycosylase domain-containing protein [Sphingomonadales bacterium]